MPGLILAAPASGAGKTTITLGLLRHLAREGVAVRSAKSGPDYIDPRFHEAATGRPCPNLDAWAMTSERIRDIAAGDGLLIIEGAMGLFDGAPPDNRGATADLARLLGLPVILIVDAARMSGSVAPLVAGFAAHDPQVRVAGVILNNVGSPRHEAMLRRALTEGPPVLGALPRSPGLHHPSRHLGLVQAGERPDLEAFLDRAADLVARHVDTEAVTARASASAKAAPAARLTPPAQRIAIARDAAFSFAYPHMLDDWHRAGAEIRPFSPLADDIVPDADFVFLPGGYPELYGARLSSAGRFMSSLRQLAQRVPVYGECGGYMALGEGLTDAEGTRWPMAGLLSLETSFAERRLHLGYRSLHAQTGPMRGRWQAHEFHYATTLKAEGLPLFDATDAEGAVLPAMGLRAGTVCGSFAHLIDRAA
jgi:cobyrinic acid a,c-diamide synthase